MALIKLGVTHHRVTISILNSLTIPDGLVSLNVEGLEEAVIIQTCNRVEIYGVCKDKLKEGVEENLLSFWKEMSKSFSSLEEGRFEEVLERSYDYDAIRYLFRLAAGLDSMIIGEDQILGQVKDSFAEAKMVGTIGPSLSLLFNRAIKLGGRVRRESKINKGSVSIGSITVQLAEDCLGDLRGKRSLLIGAGEVSMLVSKSLISKKHDQIYVTSRTYDRAKAMVSMNSGTALPFDDAINRLSEVDLIIVATKARYHLLTREMIEMAVKSRNDPLLIIDLSVPPNVEELVGELPNVRLLSIDDLRGVINRNLGVRMREVGKVEEIIQRELEIVTDMLSRERAEPLIASLYRDAEEIRVREVEKALMHLGDIPVDAKVVINDMSRAVVEALLDRPVKNMRKAAEKNEIQVLSLSEKLFQDR